MTEAPKTIKEVHSGLLQKKFTAVDLVDFYLSKISEKNKELNIFITVTEDVAYKKAKEVDKLVEELGEEAFKEYPLLGAVVAHKDLFLTKGIRTTAAAKILEGYIGDYDASVVKKIEKAGAIMIGKLNCDAWAHGSSGENSDFGATLNPINKDYVPGGSSSGSAASLAANMALISTATDTCGSTRLPANYCGVVGLKPTYGAISRYGVIAMASSLDTVGTMAKTVEDVEILFNTIKGPDGYDSTVSSMNSKLETRNSKFCVGIPKEFFGEGLDDEIRKNIEEVKKVYKASGVEFKEISLPMTKYGISAYYIIQPAEVSSNLGRYDGIRYGLDRSNFGEEAKRRIMLGTYVLSAGYYDAYYLKAMKVRTKISKEVENAFSEVDAILAPVAPTPPFKIGEKLEDPVKMYLTDIYASTANLSGIPSIAIPSGFTKKGLPLGFQLMGNKFCENTLFELGKIYEREIK